MDANREGKQKGKLAEFFKRDVVFNFFLVRLVIIFPICCPAFFPLPSPAKTVRICQDARVEQKNERVWRPWPVNAKQGVATIHTK